MLPVANVPTLHYVIEFLIFNKVKEIILATRDNFDQLKAFVNKMGYSTKGRSRKFKITIRSIKDDSESFGDVLRQVADMQLIKDDFILVRSDIITNINLHPALKMHYHVKQLESKKENQTTDSRKNKTIMTKLFIKMADSNPLRDPAFTDVTLLMDDQTKEIINY